MGHNLSGNTLLSTTITPEGASFKNLMVVASGGDAITYNGEWRIHRFNNSGTFTVTSFVGSSLAIDYLMVGGGGGGGMDMGGGGGGGGVLTGSTTLSTGSYTVTVGGGGAGAPQPGTGGQPGSHQYTVSAVSGTTTTFNSLSALGGGFGSSSYWAYTPNYGVPGNGGCGGGVGAYANASSKSGGTGTAGQGYNGGAGGPAYYGGGGGGAGAVGVSATSRPDGGAGLYSDILGRPYYWGGGGGAAGYSTGQGGYGGKGGGGGGCGYTVQGGRQCIDWGRETTGTCANGYSNCPGYDGGTNCGGGGGGGCIGSTNKGGNGGKGIVIIRYKYK